jgi:Ca2+-binding EF-hand superfamily protein
MMNKSLLIAIVLCGAASPALAQQSQMPNSAQTGSQNQRIGPFERTDANKDGVITREEVRAGRTQAFSRLDANRDGFLVREEMPKRREMRQGPKGGGDLMARADSNGDGIVTKIELDAATAVMQTEFAASMNSRRDEMFKRMDTNRDGTITRVEVEAMRAGKDGQKNGPRPNPDTNNDSKISLDEWLARPDPLFERADANKDGKVTREEAAAVVRQGRGDGGRPGRPW